MTAQHTPGPWFVDQYNDHNVRNAIGVYAANRVIPIVHSIGGDSYAQADANTNLIAAAPALLAEAMELLRNAEYADGTATVRTQDCEALEAAIKLAKGEV